MCIQSDKTSSPVRSITVSSKQIADENKIARSCGWFSIRYFRPLTLSGDPARFIFVNASKYGVVWPNVAFFIIMHAAFLHALWRIVTEPDLHRIWVACYIVGLFGGLGVTAGAHRLWSHKTYNASLPVRILLMIFFTSAGENDIFTWSRDHRLHHKYTETDADPHNSRRGGFFA